MNKRGAKISDETIEAICDLGKDEWSIAQIAEQLKLASRTVHKYLTQAGIHNPKGRRKLDDPRVTELFDSGMKPDLIAKKLRMEPYRVYKVLRNNDYELNLSAGIKMSLEDLTETDKLILIHRYGLHSEKRITTSLQTLANGLDVTREYVRQLQRAAEQKFGALVIYRLATSNSIKRDDLLSILKLKEGT